MENQNQVNDKKAQPCVRCGAETYNTLGGVFICIDCYQVRSSCCPEFGPDDLTKELNYDETNH